MKDRKTVSSRKRRSWRDVPDEVLLCLAPKGEATRAESLCPSASTCERAVFGDPRATAIILAWRFDFPVVRGE
jgi:hypothetical protein